MVVKPYENEIFCASNKPLVASCFDVSGNLMKSIAASIKTPVISPFFSIISPPETLVSLVIPDMLIAA